ncbi:MAG TPA: lipase maturation factor family protein, partial [Saprospiraceae bacterium]|nr:lipase maturation factor family protein [Saprospiraceae bacterium]
KRKRKLMSFLKFWPIMLNKNPIMVYDGDCSFCRIWIEYWKELAGDVVDYKPYQEVADRYPQIPRDQFTKSVQLIKEDGTILSGAHAVFQSLACNSDKRWMLWMYERIPGISLFSEFCYRFIARNRNGAYKVTRLLWGDHIEVSSHVLTRWIFLRLLGIIYLIAFVSMGAQIVGLVGKNGLLPVEQYLDLIRDHVGIERYWEFPTLAWFNAGDGFLQFLCWGGVALSLLLIAGVAQRAVAVLLWVCYLSLFYIGQTFLSFQWDILLLEIGFLAIAFAPMNVMPRIGQSPQPSRIILWLFWLLLFRLMFFSGYVKLTVNDPLWSNLTALTVHYETQPLPTPLSWYLHQLPQSFHVASCAIMFVIELGVPFLIFFPRRLRFLSCSLILLLMVLIMISGNYTFFNLLAIALCVLLLDDAAWKRVLPKKLWPNIRTSYVHRRRSARTGIAVVAGVVVFLNIVRWLELFDEQTSLPQPVQTISEWFSPFMIVNSYGLFRVMTNPRFEIMIEGSNDGMTWKEYEFKYKPGDVRRMPPWVEPHQPRLDWQMWFAALGSYRQNPWFVNLCVRLLQGTPSVLELIEKNPFPQSPPRYIRAQLYEYHFTNSHERQLTAAWWIRELKGIYLPPISLKVVQ